MRHFLAIEIEIGYSARMDRILISSCLMGQPVRYDGVGKLVVHSHLTAWKAEGRLIAFCPEIAGGFAVPRLPAEIEPNATAQDVLAGKARILDSDGTDVSAGFIAGAKATLSTAQKSGCNHAILTDGSPSCGSGFVYSGRFDGVRRSGLGVTAAALAQNGIRIWNQGEISALANTLSLK